MNNEAKYRAFSNYKAYNQDVLGKEDEIKHLQNLENRKHQLAERDMLDAKKRRENTSDLM